MTKIRPDQILLKTRLQTAEFDSHRAESAEDIPNACRSIALSGFAYSGCTTYADREGKKKPVRSTRKRVSSLVARTGRS